MKIDSREIQPVLVIGHGRSGTIFTGQMLGIHPEIYATIEEPSWFSSLAEVAFNPRKNIKRIPKLIKKQRKHLERKCDRPIWVDKTHPLVLLREIVEEYYPEALIIHVVRNPFDVFCSEIRHPGVMNWFKRCDEVFGMGGNSFLGTNENLENHYHSLSVPQKIAYRWYSWVKKGLLWEKESRKVLTINYEEMVKYPICSFNKIADFIGVEKCREWLKQIAKTAKTSSVNRYKRDMQVSELDEMNLILKEFLNQHDQLRDYRLSQNDRSIEF